MAGRIVLVLYVLQCLCVVTRCSSADDDTCSYVTARQSLSIDEDSASITEIQVRHNTKVRAHIDVYTIVLTY